MPLRGFCTVNHAQLQDKNNVRFLDTYSDARGWLPIQLHWHNKRWHDHDGFMTEYRKQAAFLRLLMTYDDSGEHKLLLERLDQAERNVRCTFSACLLVALIAVFGLAGLAYSAVFLPQFFHSSTHVLVRMFSALWLGSALCLLFFMCLWLWYRSNVNRIHEEGRRLVQRVLEARLATRDLPFQPGVVENPALKVLGTSGEESVGGADDLDGLTGLRKAS